MDGFNPLVLEEDQRLTAVAPSLVESGEWVAVSVGDSALMIWFPAGD